jgi:hypothetical protein
MAPLGTYYYWYEHLNKMQTYMCFYKFFFNSIYKTKYYKFLVLIYLFFIWYFYRKLKFDLMYSEFRNIKYIRILEIYNFIFRLK